MTTRFDLEQKILGCWNVTDDIADLNERIQNGPEMSTDDIANYLLGLQTIYHVKFEKMFSMFEDLISQKQL